MTFPPVAVGRCHQGRNPARAPLGHRRACVQHPQADLCRLARARGADPGVQLRIRQPDPERRRQCRGSPAISRNSELSGDVANPAPPRPWLALLEPFKAELLPGALEGYALPVSDGTEANRASIRTATDLAGRGGLDCAGRRAEERRRRALCLRDPAGDRLRTDTIAASEIYVEALKRARHRRADHHGRFGAVQGTHHHL